MVHGDHQPEEELSKLERRASRLAGTVNVLATGYRKLHGNDAKSFFISILREIDETILPRKIKVLTNKNQVAYLFVGNRRLLQVIVPGEKTNTDSQLEGDVSKVASRLIELFTDANKAVVHSKRTEEADTKSNSGHSIPSLASAASIDLTAEKNADTFEVFSSTLMSLAVAWISLGPLGHIESQNGDQTKIQHLDALFKSGLADIEAQLARTLKSPEHPGCIILGSDKNDGFILVYARSSDAGILAMLPAHNMVLIQPAWLDFIG